ncbi:diacylglycerol kinase (ATP) [Constrictibacter sp. MBR-5]|uniref:lipid kinase n=1 Tax=Constrictibacter sp. MBR-5 TaxID=3156467 RepID=UPI003392F43F
MPDRRAVLIVNRNARSGAEAYEAVVAALDEVGIEAVPPKGEATDDSIAMAAANADMLILGGGDGTLNHFAEAAVATGLPVGILPLGTANDLARTLGIPADPATACAIIAAGETRRIDLGEVNGKLFFNVASIGLSVEVATRMTKQFKKRWGVFSYPFAAADAWRAMRSFRARITADGSQQVLRSIQLAVGNGRYYGGGMSVSEDAAIDDGLLDLYCMEPRPLARMAALLPAFRAGRHRANEAVHCLRAPEIKVETSRPMRVNTDGELTTVTPATFRVVRHALEVFVPRPPEDRSEAG